MARHTLLVVVILLAGTKLADACSCASMPPCQRFWTADAVFTGVVTSVTYSEDKKQQLSHSTIAVERGFRGASGQVVLTGTVLSSCHYNFTVGQRYLVYAYRNADGTLGTGACSGTRLLADAAEDLDYAEHLPPPGSGGRIFGRVRRIEEDLLDRRSSQNKYPAGVAITLRDSSGIALDLVTDAQGAFEAAGLKPDKYAVSMDAPATARVYYEPATIDLKDRACVPVSVAYQSDGRIGGRIVDANGLPASKVWVSAVSGTVVFSGGTPAPNVSVSLVAGTVSGISTTRTDASGSFTLTGLSGSNYSVRASFYISPENNGSAETTISVVDEPVIGVNLVLKKR